MPEALMEQLEELSSVLVRDGHQLLGKVPKVMSRLGSTK